MDAGVVVASKRDLGGGRGGRDGRARPSMGGPRDAGSRSPLSIHQAPSPQPLARGFPRSSVNRLDKGKETGWGVAGALCPGSPDPLFPVRAGWRCALRSQRPAPKVRSVLGPQEPTSRSQATSARGLGRHVPGCPTNTTGVPDKDLARLPVAHVSNPRKQAEIPPSSAARGPVANLPGSPTSATGVPNKCYRGPRQILPGCPTNTTGVPNKCYRGAQQILPGCPTRGLHKTCCKTAFFVPGFGVPLFLFLL